MRSTPVRATSLSVLVLVSACTLGCAGGSSGGDTITFAVQSFDIVPGAVVPITRPISITFSEAIDFDSVTAQSVRCLAADGAPVPGDYRRGLRRRDALDPVSDVVVDERILVFQPACPLLSDASDAGLQPGGASYTLVVAGIGDGSQAVRSASGTSLPVGRSVGFTTAASIPASGLFHDPSPGHPPSPRIAASATDADAHTSRLEIGQDATNTVRFVTRRAPEPGLGAEPELEGFLAPLNLYSDIGSRVAVLLEIDQPVSNAAASLAAVSLQFLVEEANPGQDASWSTLPCRVELVRNCTETGALVRVTPQGILPQNHVVRAVLGEAFADIVGNTNPTPVVVGSFRVRTSFVPGTSKPAIAVDAWREEFATAENRDDLAPTDAVPAVWGTNGSLSATTAFPGTGGPGGSFVYRVRASGGAAVYFNTTYQLVTDETNAFTQVCQNGVLDVHSLIVEPTAVLVVQGPNPFTVHATHLVDIRGKILLDGNRAPDVLPPIMPLSTIHPGGLGRAGGGDGGYGSPQTTQSSATGEDGFGAYAIAHAGGRGGEASVSTALLRGAGGGGGAFAEDQIRRAGTALIPGCPEQVILGLDAESGARGEGVNSAVHPGFQPQGGARGERPFGSLDPQDPVLAALDDNAGTPTQALFHLDDFWGDMRVGSTVIHGELAGPWAGSGGGGGGDVVVSSSFPAVPFSPAISERPGGGGGGGGGSILVRCLGDVRFGANGRIDASGGPGASGSNSPGSLMGAGGGGGGGSGGHVVLQAAGRIDFSACVAGGAVDNFASGAGILARGGQGGAGANGAGGAGNLGVETVPNQDMLPPHSYGASAPCAVAGNTVGVVPGCGGDGGPGLVQLHVADASGIVLPTSGTPLSSLIHPTPVGATPLNVDVPSQWNRLVVPFGRTSRAMSKWIPLGATHVDPRGSLSGQTEFWFAGTNPSTGLVQTNAGSIGDLPPILTGNLGPAPMLPHVGADDRSVVFDASTLTDAVYAQGMGIWRRFVLLVGSGANATRYEVASASIDSGAGTLRITVSESGAPLAGRTGAVSVLPRFFRVQEAGGFDHLSTTNLIRIEFQAAPAGPSGGPAPSAATPWVSDITALNTTTAPANTSLRFLRFRVTFDLAVGQPTVALHEPLPGLDFLSVPFRF